MKTLMFSFFLFLTSLVNAQCISYQPAGYITTNVTLCSPFYSSELRIGSTGTVTINHWTDAITSIIMQSGAKLIIDGCDIQINFLYSVSNYGDVEVKNGGVFVVYAAQMNKVKVTTGSTFWETGGGVVCNEIDLGAAGTDPCTFWISSAGISLKKITSTQYATVGIGGNMNFSPSSNITHQIAGEWHIYNTATFANASTVNFNSTCIFDTENVVFTSAQTYTGSGYIQINNACTATSVSLPSAINVYRPLSSCSLGSATIVGSPQTCP